MDTLTVNGMVLSAMPIGEYDRRVVILTTDLGRISAFVKGARRPNSSLLAAARPFSMGEFTLYAGRDSYTVQAAVIREHFESICADVTKMAYGCYFMEAAGFASEENEEAKELLNLLYFSLRALENKAISDELVKLIFEIRLFAVCGVYPQVFECNICKKKFVQGWLDINRGNSLCTDCKSSDTEGQIYLDTSSAYTLQYILTAPVGKLYTFLLEEKVQNTLRNVTAKWRKRYYPREFKSLTVLEQMRQMLPKEGMF